MKKILTAVFTMTLVVFCFCVLSLQTNAAFVASGVCDENLTWTLDNTGTLTISGSGPLSDLPSSSSAPWYGNRSSIKTIIIEPGVTYIGDYAFYECTNLTNITIPNTVTGIAWHVFRYCSSLKSITIPDSVTSIAGYTFEYCTGLTSVTIPDSVVTIGNAAFGSCSQLTTLTLGSGLEAIGNGTFRLCRKLKNIYYNGTKAQWDQITIEAGNPFQTTTVHMLTGDRFADTLFWSLNDAGVLTISGNGPMADYQSSSDAPWCDYRDRIKNVTVKPGVTSVGNHTFNECYNLISVTLSDSVTSIGAGAFSSCYSLNSVAMGNGVTGIGADAFFYSGLTSVTIPDSVTTIGCGAFSSCYSLKTATIGNGVTTIEERGFYCCTGLNAVTIGYRVTTVEDSAFDWCESLTDVCYAGTQKQWSRIHIGKSNGPLQTAVRFVPAYILGDLDGINGADEDDVIYLLQHLLMPEEYAVYQFVDYDEDDSVDEEDVIYLLQHLLMPDEFPL